MLSATASTPASDEPPTYTTMARFACRRGRPTTLPLKFERSVPILPSNFERRAGGAPKTQRRAPARHARHARPQGTPARPHARLGDHRTPRAGFAERVEDRTGLPLPRAVPPRGTGTRLVQLGRERQQPPRALVRAHLLRPRAPRRRAPGVAPPLQGGGAHPRHGVGRYVVATAFRPASPVRLRTRPRSRLPVRQRNRLSHRHGHRTKHRRGHDARGSAPSRAARLRRTRWTRTLARAGPRRGAQPLRRGARTRHPP